MARKGVGEKKFKEGVGKGHKQRGLGLKRGHKDYKQGLISSSITGT